LLVSGAAPSASRSSSHATASRRTDGPAAVLDGPAADPRAAGGSASRRCAGGAASALCGAVASALYRAVAPGRYHDAPVASSRGGGVKGSCGAAAAAAPSLSARSTGAGDPARAALEASASSDSGGSAADESLKRCDSAALDASCALLRLFARLFERLHAAARELRTMAARRHAPRAGLCRARECVCVGGRESV